MTKINISLKELDMIKYTVNSRFQHSSDDMMTLVIKEFLSVLKRKGLELEVEIEKEVEYE